MQAGHLHEWADVVRAESQRFRFSQTAGKDPSMAAFLLLSARQQTVEAFSPSVLFPLLSHCARTVPSFISPSPFSQTLCVAHAHISSLLQEVNKRTLLISKLVEKKKRGWVSDACTSKRWFLTRGQSLTLPPPHPAHQFIADTMSPPHVRNVSLHHSSN